MLVYANKDYHASQAYLPIGQGLQLRNSFLQKSIISLQDTHILRLTC